MDIKEAIEILKDENRDICYGTTLADEATKLAVEIMERTRWIPVSERLPTKKDADRLGRVLSYNSYMDWVDTFSWHGVEHSDSVTHWMPLPEPPQEVE